jgi:hypothetical protein
VGALAFLPGARRLLSAGSDGRLIGWTLGDDGWRERLLWSGAGPVRTLLPSPDGARVAIATTSGVHLLTL